MQLPMPAPAREPGPASVIKRMFFFSVCFRLLQTPRSHVDRRRGVEERLVVGETRQPHFWWQILRLRWR